MSKVKISGGGRCNVMHNEVKTAKEISEGCAQSMCMCPVDVLSLIPLFPRYVPELMIL
jgi:hypothetical protein